MKERRGSAKVASQKRRASVKTSEDALKATNAAQATKIAALAAEVAAFKERLSKQPLAPSEN